MRFDKLTQAIAAGAVWRLGMAANDLQIVTSSAPLSVTLYKGGAVIGQGSRVLAGDFFRGLDFDLVELGSEVAQEVTILLSDGTSGSNRIVGEVSVISGEMRRVKDGLSFYAYVGAAGVVGEYSNLQFWNPAASGKNLVISKLRGTSSIAQLVSIAWNTAELAGAGSVSPAAKMLGGFVSVCVPRNGKSLDLFSPMNTIGVTGIAADGGFSLDLDEPIVLAPGKGLMLASQSTGATLTFSAEYFENAVE